ncbi:MAG TPA: hypothetical protein VLB69_10600 [Rudaea sp.]|nr:hypothetical protein [Rudaea sp.]
MFALDDLPAGTEVTVDCRHVLGPGQGEAFLDAHSGRTIVGYAWYESLARSTSQMHEPLPSAAAGVT